VIGPLGYAEPLALAALGDHLSRHRGASVGSARIRRDSGGALVLTTIVTTRSQ
jgi:hypothetical protein